MALKIEVKKNHLPTCPSPFIVRSDTSDVVEYDKLVDLMATGRTTLTKTDILAALQLYKEELSRQLAEGKTVKTPTGSFYACASGCMDSLDEAFLPDSVANNHALRIHHKAERSFEEAIVRNLLVQREEKPDRGAPCIHSVKAAGSGEDEVVKPAGMVEVKGLRLRFDPRDPRQGVFFVDSGGRETRSPFYPLVMPGTILATVPSELVPGPWTLALRAAVNGRDVREHRFEGLAVAPA